MRYFERQKLLVKATVCFQTEGRAGTLTLAKAPFSSKPEYSCSTCEPEHNREIFPRRGTLGVLLSYRKAFWGATRLQLSVLWTTTNVPNDEFLQMHPVTKELMILYSVAALGLHPYTPTSVLLGLVPVPPGRTPRPGA